MVNVFSKNNQVDISTSNNIVEVFPKSAPSVQVIQPTTSVVEILTGPIGPAGPPGSGSVVDISYIVKGNITASVATGSQIFLINSSSIALFTIDYQGSTTITSNADTVFLIKNNNSSIFSVSQSGVIVLATQSATLASPAPNGGIYFTSSSFYVGLD